MKASDFIKRNATSEVAEVVSNVARQFADSSEIGNELRAEVSRVLSYAKCFTEKNFEKSVEKTVKMIETARAKADKANRKGVIYIMSIHRSSKTIYAGTIESLIEDVFGYALDCGHSWNSRIPSKPKTKVSLVNALNNSAYETNHYSDSYELSSEEEYLRNGGTLSYECGNETLSGSVTIRR